MIDISDVLFIHSTLIQKFGGIPGVRSHELLESALKRPLQTFDGKDLYPTPQEKASAVLESIVINHPFLDGNKRTGYVLMRLILLQNQLDLIADEEETFGIKALDQVKKRLKKIE